MKIVGNEYRKVAFSLISALLVVGAAWTTKDIEDSDVWLYVFSVGLILYSAFEIRASVNSKGLSKWALAVLGGASAIILGTWWANGAEDVWVFLTCLGLMLIAFFILTPKKTDLF